MEIFINQGKDSTIEPAYLTETKQVISEPNLEALSVTPTTSPQSITPESPVDGYSSVSVSAVTSAIDQNIVAGNIKKDVEILGVTGSYEGSGAETFGVTITVNSEDDITSNKTYSEIMTAINAGSKVTFTITVGGTSIVSPGYYVFINAHDSSDKIIMVALGSQRKPSEAMITEFVGIKSNNEIQSLEMDEYI